MNRRLSPAAQIYVLAVTALGLVPLGWSVYSLVSEPPPAAWYIVAALTLLSGRLSIRIPSKGATISVSEGFIFTCALLFGPAAATAIAVIDGAAVALWSRRRSWQQTAFGLGEPALSVSIASLLFYAAAGVPPLFEQPSTLLPLVLPLFLLTLTYFALNTLLAGAAVWLDAGGAPLALLRQHLPHLSLDFAVSLSLAAAVVQTSETLTVAALVVLVPMLLVSYISSHHVAGRLEDTSRHLAELRRLYDSTVETLAMAIDAKDQVTHGHIRRVQLLCGRVARGLGADTREIQALEAAALLHDLGKLAVPEHILNKPGPLTPAEYTEMKKHAEVGASILSAIDFPFPVVPIVRHHHENWDGTGYPDGVQGTAIPLGARILSVVDCYDALTSDRPYRRRMTHAAALDIIRSRSGGMYDPQVVEAFVRLKPAEDPEMDPQLDAAEASLRAKASRALQPASAAHDTPAHAPTAPATDERPAEAGAIRRATEFLSTLRGAGWSDAGLAVASFIPDAIPDAVAALFRFDEESNQLVVAGMHRGFDARIPEAMTLGQGVTGWVAANRQSMANTDAELDLGEIARIAHPPLRLCVSVPLLDGDQLAGALTVYSPYAFNESDRLLIQNLAGQLPALLCPEQDAPTVLAAAMR